MWFARADEHEGTFVLSTPDLNALKLPLTQAMAIPTPAAAASAAATPSATPKQ
jgi:hypothetical protein